MTTQFTDELLSVEAVASALDCADTTVEEHVRTGHLPGIKLGRSWVFPRTALLQSLSEMARNQAEGRKTKPIAPARGIAVTRPGRRQSAPQLPQFNL